MIIENSSVQSPGRVSTGRQAIGTTRVQLTHTRALVRGITLKAVAANAGVIFVGGPEVTTTTGWPLPVNETIFIPVSSLEQIFVIADTADQNLSWIGM